MEVSYPTVQRMGVGSGNLGRQPETLKGEKLGGCLRKQGVGKIKPNLSGCGGSYFNIRRRDICRPLTLRKAALDLQGLIREFLH